MLTVCSCQVWPRWSSLLHWPVIWEPPRPAPAWGRPNGHTHTRKLLRTRTHRSLKRTNRVLTKPCAVAEAFVTFSWHDARLVPDVIAYSRFQEANPTVSYRSEGSCSSREHAGATMQGDKARSRAHPGVGRVRVCFRKWGECVWWTLRKSALKEHLSHQYQLNVTFKLL